jgi:glutamine amidotransferase
MNADKKKNIVIIDYGLGNLFSVEQACRSLGFFPIISNDPKDLLKADAAILPGVGAFKAAMENLTKSKMKEAIIDFVGDGKPLMGVCLGLQLLFEESEEFENCEGLGLIKGTVKKIRYEKKHIAKVPQIGWNTIYPKKGYGWNDTPLKTIKSNEFMYFVHSYYVAPTNSADILTLTTYSDFEYCSAVLRDNIFATQFHPEKSGGKGVEIYKHWYNKI